MKRGEGKERVQKNLRRSMQARGREGDRNEREKQIPESTNILMHQGGREGGKEKMHFSL